MIRDGGDTLTFKGFDLRNHLFTRKLTIQPEMVH